jgi:hypothetical protein
MPEVVDFFTNSGVKDAPVEAPAFSITKVLATGAAVIAPIAAGISDWLKEGEGLENQHWVALALGLLGFLAVITAADVLARSVAAAADKKAKAAEASRALLIRFDAPLSGELSDPKFDIPVEVVAAAGGDQPYFLVRQDKALTWVPAAEITFGSKPTASGSS